MDFYSEIPMPSFEERVRNLVLYAMEKGTNLSINDIEDEAIAIAHETPDFSLMGYIAGGNSLEQQKMDLFIEQH
jgi:hypothetical protein